MIVFAVCWYVGLFVMLVVIMFVACCFLCFVCDLLVAWF